MSLHTHYGLIPFQKEQLDAQRLRSLIKKTREGAPDLTVENLFRLHGMDPSALTAFSDE